jgi:leader peptidase (prepilin peptidase) / N-methyltransferase
VDALAEIFLGPMFWLPPLWLAPFVGSLMGVLIVRLPAGRTVLVTRSCCDHCGHVLAPRDMVPLLSFAVLRGRCRSCRSPIGWLPPAIELAALGVAAWALLAVPRAEVWVTCLFGWMLLTAAWIDLRTMLLPDALTLPLLLAGLGVTALPDAGSTLDHAAAAALGYGALFGIARLYRWLRGREGMGMGDAKLFAALGAWLGLADLPAVLLVASCLGLVAAGGAAIAGRRMTAATAIPFGPFLALAGWLVWLYA